MYEICKVEKIEENLFKCIVCGFSYHETFTKNCVIEPTQEAPYKCKFTGNEVEVLDLSKCNCAGRGTEVSIHRCNLYNTDCGLLSLLKYAKRKELEDRGIRNCMQCPDRFTK